MQVVLNTTAVALHPDVLQQHPLTAIRMHHSLEEDAHPALWTVALLISFTLHLLLVALQKSGKPYVLCFHCLFCVIATV